MKTFSLEMEVCRQRHNHDLAWLAELDWDGEVGRYSSRPLTIGGWAYRPILAAIKGLRLAMPSVVPDGDADGGAVKIELVNTYEEGAERFELKADGQGLEGRTVRIGFVFLDPAVVLEPADVIWIQTSQIEASVFETARAVLHLRESPSLAGRRLIGRKLVPLLDPRISPAALGRTIPFIFGRIERSPLVPFRVGRRGYLREALHADDLTVAVEDVSLFPENGSVQVGEEVIAYSVTDPAARTLGRSDSPVVRTAPAYHPAGAAVDSIPEGGFQYLVADHLCRAVGPIYSGMGLVDPTQYVVASESLGGRQVQKVSFPTLPSKVSYGALTQTRRIDGREDENLWTAGTGNAAESPLSALGGGDQITAAVLAVSKTPLEIEYLGDLTAGLSTHGSMRRCRLGVECSATACWSAATEVTVELGRGGESVSFSLGRPPLAENLATVPAHGHSDTIRDRVDDTRALFDIAQQSLAVDFDETLPPASGWADCDRAIDGNLGTWTQNTPLGGPAVTSLLAFRLVREPLGTREAVTLEAVEFHVRLATSETLPVLAALEAAIGGKYADSWQVEATAAPKSFQCVIATDGLTIENLAAANEFSVRSSSGRQLKVHGAWLCLKYRTRIAGQTRAASQRRSGAVETAPAVIVPLPTKSYRQEFDVTEFVEAHGGWAFFAPASNARPFVRIAFGSMNDPTAIRVSAIGFEVEYVPRTGVEVHARLDATVEGVEQAGQLLENPADVIQWLVTDAAGLGWESDTLDAASFAQTREWLEGRSWRLSRRFGVPLPLFSLLEQIARESGCRLYWEAGRLRLRPLPSFLLASDAVAALNSAQILSAPLVKRCAPWDEIAHVVRLRYGGGYDLGGGERRTIGVQWAEAVDATAPSTGRREREFQAHWLASGTSARAASLAALWLGQLAHPPRTVEVTLPMTHSHLERGDVVVVDHPASRLEGATGEIVAVEFVDGRHVRVTIALQSWATYCWYGDSRTFIVHLPGNREKMFVLEGSRVAALDRAGQLRLRGEAVEKGLAPHAMSAAIEHDLAGHRLYFGVGDAANGYAAVFALDAGGRLLLRGAAREQADLSALNTDVCHRAEPSRFLFSCDLTTVVCDYEAAADRLDLAGTIVENAML